MSVAKKTRTGTTYAFPRTLRNQRALCATCSTSGKATSSRTDASVCDFLWQLVPADAVAHVRAELPLHRLGCLDGELQQPRGLGNRLVDMVVRDQRRPLPQQLFHLGQVPRDGPPPPPVRAEQFAEAVGVDGCLGATPQWQRGEQVDDVPQVLLVQLDDLELGQQHVHRVDRQRLAVEGGPEV